MQIKLKFLLIACFTLLIGCSSVSLTLAQAPPPAPDPAPKGNGLGTVTQPAWGLHTVSKYTGGVEAGLPVFVNALLNFLTGVAAVWLLFVIITSGIKIISSARSPEDFTAQMKKIMWSCIGLVVVALAYVIVTWLLKAFFGKYDIINNPVQQLITK